MAKILSELSDALAATVAETGDSVVRVEGRSRLPASGVVWSAEGVIVTAHHVLERDDDITVGLPDGNTVSAKLAGRDPTTDVAVLRTSADGLAPARWIDPDDVRVANLVLALGRPGQTVQATLGVVSALGKSWRTRAGGRIDRYLQSDVAMYPGFSGGPLVNASGGVVGLNTSALLRGVTVSLPSPTIKGTVETLLEHGKIRRGYLGVGAQVVRLPNGEQETALLLVSVEPKSAAESAGLLLGDTLVSLNGHPLQQLDDLLSALTADMVGKTVAVQVIRGGERREISVTVGERG